MATANAGDHIDKNHQPSKLSSFTCNILRVHAVSFGVQTNHMRQPLNNDTRPFYLPEFLSKIKNTVSSLSGRYDTGGHVACRDHACYPEYAAKDSAFETSTQIPRDVSIPVGY